jgi:hypothetical protein
MALSTMSDLLAGKLQAEFYRFRPGATKKRLSAGVPWQHHGVQEKGRNEVFEDDLNLLLERGDGLKEAEFFQSIYHPGKWLLLASWKDTTVPWCPRSFSKHPKEIRHRTVRVIRDYGMFDRREAPQ